MHDCVLVCSVGAYKQKEMDKAPVPRGLSGYWPTDGSRLDDSARTTSAAVYSFVVVVTTVLVGVLVASSLR
jgi:hypothetical protein